MSKNLIISINIEDANNYLDQITTFINDQEIIESIRNKHKHYVKLISGAEYTTCALNNISFQGLRMDRIYVHRDIPIGIFEDILKPIIARSYLPLDERIYLF